MIGKKKRADITVGFLCNNNCLFCTDAQDKHLGNKTIDQIEKELIELRKVSSEVLLKGGEPFLRGDLVDIINHAKKMEFKKIIIESNGRVFFYPAFCKKIISVGIRDFIILLNDSNEKSHDLSARVEGSYRQTVTGIRNIIEQGGKVTVKIVLTKENYKQINKTIELAHELGVNDFIVSFPNTIGLETKEILPPLSSIKKYLNESIEYALSNEINIILQDIPCCIIPEYEDYIDDDFNEEKCKTLKCLNCKLTSKCGGLWKSYIDAFGYEEIIPISNAPEEIKIELTRKCNFNCEFCYNTKKNAKEMSKEQILSLLDQIKLDGIKKVRFTGGEPLLRKDIAEILVYAKKKGLEVILNTNGTLFNNRNYKLLDNVDYILISLNSFNKEEDCKLSGSNTSFKNRLNLIKNLSNKKDIKIWVSTVATKNNISHLEEFYKLVKSLKIDEWFLLRPLPNINNKKPIDYLDVKVLINKILKLNSKYNMPVYIANSLPFCSYNPLKIRKICVGGKYDSGHRKITVDAYGNVRQDYCNKTILGNIKKDSILSCWHSDYLNKVRNLELVSNQCKKCNYLNVCKAGLGLIKNKGAISDFLMIKDFKILLINPKFYDFTLVIEPLALEYIAAMLQKEGFQVKILDLNITETDISSYISNYLPNLIGISNFTMQAEEAYRIGREIKSNFPCILLAYGGVYSSFVYGGMNSDAFPKEPFREGKADFVITGEGEKIYLELVNSLYSDNKAANIDGLFLKKNDKIIGNSKRNVTLRLDELPFPARDLVDIYHYKNDIHVIPYSNETAVDMIVSRGCPNDCSYCVSPRFYQHNIRIRSAENAFNEIKEVVDNYDIRKIHFHDDCFLLNTKNVEKLCNLLITKKLGIKWICLANINNLKKAKHIFGLMNRAGCVGVEIGLESGDGTVLTNMNKNQKIEEIIEMDRLLKQKNIRPMYLIISFFPGETINTSKKTAELLLKIESDLPVINYMLSVHTPYSFGQFATPYPGTKFYETADKDGILFANSWRDYNRQKINFIPYSFLHDVPNKKKNIKKQEFYKKINKFKKYINYYLNNPCLIGFSSYKDYVNFLYKIYCKSNGTKTVEELFPEEDIRSISLGIKLLSMFSLIEGKNKIS